MLANQKSSFQWDDSACAWGALGPPLRSHLGQLSQSKGWCSAVAIKQRIQSSHIPPCHRHMVIATNFSSLFDLLHCSAPQRQSVQ